MILLDTHIWLWWVSNPELLSKKAEKAITKAVLQEALYISSISAWEVAMLVKKDRLQLTLEVQDWIRKTEALPFVNFIPIDNNIAVKSATLPGKIHDDPADRIIIATALNIGCSIVTKDRRILAYSKVKTIW